MTMTKAEELVYAHLILKSALYETNRETLQSALKNYLIPLLLIVPLSKHSDVLKFAITILIIGSELDESFKEVYHLLNSWEQLNGPW